MLNPDSCMTPWVRWGRGFGRQHWSLEWDLEPGSPPSTMLFDSKLSLSNYSPVLDLTELLAVISYQVLVLSREDRQAGRGFK